MNSATSTRRDRSAAAAGARPPVPSPAGFQAGHFFLLIAMIGATAVVMTAPITHPVALLLLSAAVICAGLVGLAMSRAVTGFFQPTSAPQPIRSETREALVREKQLVLRSIKELEFDKAMGKISEADFTSIAAGLRARALVLMKDLDRPDQAAHEAPMPAPVTPVAPAAHAARACAECGTPNDADAKFCKSCGTRMAQ